MLSRSSIWPRTGDRRRDPAGLRAGNCRRCVLPVRDRHGATGPDRGRGGRYLIVPTDFEGDIPDGYFVGRSPSRVNLLILRGLLVDGRPEAPTRTFKEGLKIYPLSAADNPPAMEFVSGSRKSFNTIHANNADFYEGWRR